MLSDSYYQLFLYNGKTDPIRYPENNTPYTDWVQKNTETMTKTTNPIKFSAYSGVVIVRNQTPNSSQDEDGIIAALKPVKKEDRIYHYFTYKQGNQWETYYTTYNVTEGISEYIKRVQILLGEILTKADELYLEAILKQLKPGNLTESEDQSEPLTIINRFNAERGYWNDDPFDRRKQFSVQITNNCYNYAVSLRTNTFAQPGRGTGNDWHSIGLRQGVKMGAISDGLQLLPPSVNLKNLAEVIVEGSPSLVALVLGRVEKGGGYCDFHWLKLVHNALFQPQNRHLIWSHKPGSGKATVVGKNFPSFKEAVAELKRICADATLYPGGADIAGYFLADVSTIRRIN